MADRVVFAQETYYELLLAGQFIDDEERSVLRWGRNAKVRKKGGRRDTQTLVHSYESMWCCAACYRNRAAVHLTEGFCCMCLP